tara:strand:- start:529 stop:693 length:165 start_codon:yes stop_codon:yes gene_type:complete
MKANKENLALNLSEFEIAIAGLNISFIVTLIFIIYNVLSISISFDPDKVMIISI